jgi:hypothetical protein
VVLQNNKSGKEMCFNSPEYMSVRELINQMGAAAPSNLLSSIEASNSADLRYCFSLRSSTTTTNDLNRDNCEINTSASDNNQSSSASSSTSASSTATSSELYNDLEERRLIKSKGLVCLTDGSSTSYKFLVAGQNEPSIVNNINTSTCNKLTSNKIINQSVEPVVSKPANITTCHYKPIK